MSEWLDRNRFGPILVTIDSISKDGVSIRIEPDEGEFSVINDPVEIVDLRTNIEPFVVAEMFRWLADAITRLQIIKNATDAVESEMRSRTERMIADAFGNRPCSLRDLDYMSFQTQYYQNQDRQKAKTTTRIKT
jgi:hypothetical protein